IAPDYEASRARGLVLRSLEHQSLPICQEREMIELNMSWMLNKD
ncbi:hypothetical protein Tco_1170753, partial [Tanacetum coccineum]